MSKGKDFRGFKVGDKVQMWVPTNQRGSDGHPMIDLAAGVVVEVDGDAIYKPYRVEFDNLDGTYINRWVSAPDIDYRDWNTTAEDMERLHNPKTHTVSYVMAYEVDNETRIEVFRAGNEQRIYAKNFRYYTKQRDVDRLLCIVNSDNYSREIKRGHVTGCLFITCRRK